MPQPPPRPTGLYSLPAELLIMIFSYLNSYMDHISCASISPVWYDLLNDPRYFPCRYTRSKLRYTMTYPDERYHIHRLLRDYYFIVHSEPESKQAMTDSDSMTVTLIPVTSVSSSELDRHPNKLSWLDINQLEHRPISSIPDAMTFTDPPFLEDPIWIDGRDLPPEEEPDCNIWFYPPGCSHKLGSVQLPVSSFTVRSMLSNCISQAATASKLVIQGCQQCWDICKGGDKVFIPEGIKPVYSQKVQIQEWTYRNRKVDWVGMFALERYFVNVQDIDDGETCGKLVKPWHWTCFWNQIVYEGECWAPTKEGNSCVLLGLDDVNHIAKRHGTEWYTRH